MPGREAEDMPVYLGAARVAKLVDAAPLKGASPQGDRGFESRPGHFRIFFDAQ
jgi:hypothetical protein